ncbi:MAG: response regulator, partial [Oxalobacteraceae bacterium]
ALAELLECEGAHVVANADAASALERAKTAQFDLIVGDLDMPGRDGHWLIQRLREEPNAQRAISIAVSASTRPVDREQALAAGFDSYLGKPLDSNALVTEVTRLKAARKH